MSDEWIERHRRFREATIAGDLAGMRAAVENPANFPNSPTTTECYEYPLISALFDGPLETVRELLMLGADSNIDPGDGYPPLHAALRAAKRIGLRALNCCSRLAQIRSSAGPTTSRLCTKPPAWTTPRLSNCF